MATKFALTRDINGYNGFGLKFTDTAYSCTLAAASDTTLTVPAKSTLGGAAYSKDAEPTLIAIFSYSPGESVWVALNTTAAVPAGATFAATASELNPSARQVVGGDVIHFISATANVDVSVSFYWIT